MSDLELTGFWMTVLIGGALGCVAIHAIGLATTYVRDLLHVGAGVWVLGWPYWHGTGAPLALALAITAGIALVPLLSPRLAIAGHFQRSVSGGDERWTGLVFYGCSYTVLTAVGLAGAPFPAAAGLLALSLGDGIGGAVGRRFGTIKYRSPWGKTKSLEGSIAVATAAAAGVLIASLVFDVALAPGALLGLGIVAALAEAAAPRASDNLLVPAAVFTAALFAVR